MCRAAVIPDEVLDLTESFGFRDRIQDVFDLTQEMFPGDVTVEVESDLDWPGDEYIVFIVQSSAPPAEAIAKEADWHRQVTKLVPDRLDRICLSNVPRS